MSNQLAIKERAKTIQALLAKPEVKQQIARAIPKHLSPERLLRVATTSILRNPKLLECTPESLLGCIMTCAQLGLEPDQFLGQAYLVPFWNSKKKCYEAQLIPGYRGYIALARRSGELATVSAHVVYENDHFELVYGVEDKLIHKPALGDRGKPIGAYAIFKFKDGSYCFTFMPTEDIEKIRQRSKTPDDGPWVTDWGEMAKKTVIKRLAKLAPMSVEFQKASVLDDMAMMGESQTDIFAQEFPGLTEMEEVKQAKVIDLASQFDAQIPADVDRSKVEEYLRVCANYFGKPVEEIKAEALKNPDNFWTAFRQWASQKPAIERQKEKTTEVKQPQETAENAQNEAKNTTSQAQNTQEKKATHWKYDFLNKMAEMKKLLGEERYYQILGGYGYEKSNQIKTQREATKVFQAMQLALKELDESAQE